MSRITPRFDPVRRKKREREKELTNYRRCQASEDDPAREWTHSQDWLFERGAFACSYTLLRTFEPTLNKSEKFEEKFERLRST